ncbi:hypothetical protein WA026_005467 [Henosepilachna vigintioctopunctata]|uniref:Aminopeptidase n=1 Tax=Henosepilachna vigintioctopunctata TaxID=420089 RepID=A0AAW1U275_9CUCU
MRPNLARRIFPCFDEPAFKVPFIVHVARKKTMTAISNMPLQSTEDMQNNPGWVWDHFHPTPPMSTFSLGIVISEFASIIVNKTSVSNGAVHNVRVWSRPDFIESLQNVTKKVENTIDVLEEFWGLKYPLPKLDIVTIPNFQATRPADSWGLLLFKESELTGKGTWNLAHELSYQWLGGLATPYWWSDAHINTALVRYVTAYTILKVDDADSFNNWPMTMLYSIYYEFSKRYPHGKSTVIKQDSTSTKTELVFRMLNYTIGESTFKKGLQKFMADRQYKTFFGDDIWNSLTEQARIDKTLDEKMSVNDIAASWITKDRLPVVNVTRNYNDNSAHLTQKVYLRERPHDVPDQDKFLWWLPIIIVTQNNLDFSNSKPKVWMKMEKEIKIENIASSKDFIIVNPEEIGPFPVNYDEKNWNMLSEFLCTEGRMKIPVNTRAKLLHDAWNLAYAGDLSFAIALNMTRFLKNERDHLAWDPVFTLIDHIGKNIETPEIHDKFQAYVRQLLTPLYKELGSEAVDGESENRGHLRSSCKIFLCQAGYKPCIDEAQRAYKKWMEMENPDEGIRNLANQYLCPVFKWGTWEEWYFGFQRVLRFPEDRKQSERTYLLKTLAGCPNDLSTLEKFLNLTILADDDHFKEKDIYLIYNMLTGNPKGYTALFIFLRNNWDQLKKRYESKPHLWNSLVTSATTVFKTQEGLEMVSHLYIQKQGQFGTADFVIEKALKSIKDEAKWSNENLPVINKWLDNYLKENEANSQ